MASGEVHRELVSARGTKECWEILTDPHRVASWVDVVDSVEELEPLAAYQGVLQDRVGPFQLRADLSITVTELADEQLIRFVAEGEDRQVGSRLHIDAGMRLSPGEKGGSLLQFSGSYKVEGRIATLGDAMIHKKATAAFEQFLENAAQETQ